MKVADMKFTAAIVARTNSTRLRKKVLLKFEHLSLIEYIINNMKSVQTLDDLWVATSEDIEDDILENIAEQNSIKCYRGSRDQVIERLLAIGQSTQSDYVVRVTGDNIFTDAILLGELIKRVTECSPDYARVIGAPVGITAEVISYKALKKAYKLFDPNRSEYLMWYMFDPSKFETLVVDVSDWNNSNNSLTVDTPDDWVKAQSILKELKQLDPTDLININAVIKNAHVPNIDFKPGDLVKLPEGAVRYSDFLAEYHRRISLVSHKFILSEEEYALQRSKINC